LNKDDFNPGVFLLIEIELPFSVYNVDEECVDYCGEALIVAVLKDLVILTTQGQLLCHPFYTVAYERYRFLVS